MFEPAARHGGLEREEADAEQDAGELPEVPEEPEAGGMRITLRDMEPWGIRMVFVGGAA